VSEQGVGLFMAKTYWWMVLGLIVSAVFSYLPVTSIEVFTFLYGPDGTNIVGCLVLAGVMLLLAFIIPKKMNDISFGSMLALFVLFSIVTGLFLSAIHFVYEPTVIIKAFLITIAIFLTMAVIGTITKKDLSGIGSICTIGLIGIIIASAVNWLLGSEFLDYVISWGAIVVFLGLTAYDAQKLKEYASRGDNYSIYGALQLYLDFINIFLHLARLLAKSDD
jgi:FtsH-binding integral membrane protein